MVNRTELERCDGHLARFAGATGIAYSIFETGLVPSRQWALLGAFLLAAANVVGGFLFINEQTEYKQTVLAAFMMNRFIFLTGGLVVAAAQDYRWGPSLIWAVAA